MTLRIGTRKQLFVDDTIVERLSDVTQTFHQAHKCPQNPVVWGDRPWELYGNWIYGTVVYDEKLSQYRMWYQTNSGLPKGVLLRDYVQGDDGATWRRVNSGSTYGSMVCYATSSDGIHWEKPDLDIIEWNGSTKNNIVWATGYLDAYDASIIIDEDNPDPELRYKMYYWDIRDSDRAQGMWLAISPDGLHWKPYQDMPLIQEIGDVLPTVYDEQKDRYLSFTKIEVVRPGDDRYWRSVGMSQSPDGLSWSTPRLIIESDEQDVAMAQAAGGERTEFYGLAGFPYEGMYLGLLWVFRIDRFNPPGTTRGWDDGPIDVQLAYSHDGEQWMRTKDRSPVIPVNPPGNFDGGSLYTVNRPIVTDDQILIYYCGSALTHGNDHPPNYNAIGLATLRRDGFASLGAGPWEGEVLTKPFILEGNSLELNIDAHRGYARVELTTPDGEPLEGFSYAECDLITNDEVRCRVTWNGSADVSRIQGAPVRLRVGLRHAQWYAFQIIA